MLIKVAGVPSSLNGQRVHDQGKGLTLPTDVALIVAGVVLAFAAFAVTLAWGSFYTRNFRAPGAGE